MSDTPDLARIQEVAEKAATRLTEWLDDFDRNNADDHDNDDFEVGQDELIEVPAEALRATLAAQSPLLDRIAELEGERTTDAIYRREETAARLAAEAQVSALQAQVDGLREAVKPFFDLAVATTVEGSPDYLDWIVESKDWMVIFSFGGCSINLGQLRALADLRLSQPPADEAAKGEG